MAKIELFSTLVKSKPWCIVTNVSKQWRIVTIFNAYSLSITHEQYHFSMSNVKLF